MLKRLLFFIVLLTVSLSRLWSQDTKLAWNLDENKPLIQLEDEYTKVCPKANYIHPSNLTHNSISFSWLPLKGVTEYIVYYKAQHWDSFLDLTVNGTFCRLNNLIAGTRYEFQLQPVCDGQYADPYNFHINTNPMPSCEAPEGTEIASSGHQSAKLKWKKAEGAKKYKVSYRPETETDFKIAETKDNYIELIKLTPNTLYEARIHSVAANGKQSQNSAFITFRTLPEYLLSMFITPTDLRITSLGAWTKVDWMTLEPASSFIVHISRDGGKTWSEFATVYEPNIVIPTEDKGRIQIKIQATGSEENLSAFSEVIELGAKLPVRYDVEDPAGESSTVASASPKKMTVYPNPVKEMVNIKLEDPFSGVYEIAVEDETGKILFETIVSGKFGEAYFTLPPGFKGLYHMRVRAKNELYRTKILVD